MQRHRAADRSRAGPASWRAALVTGDAIRASIHHRAAVVVP